MTQGLFSTTEITSEEISSDNPIHQRLLAAYAIVRPYLQGKVLEIGCGFGRGLEMILEVCDDYNAIDKNDQLIQYLSSKYPQCTFKKAFIPPISLFEEGTFDTIISFQVIEHIKNDQLFVEEIHRLLKPNGKAIITTPNNLFSLTRNPWHVREYTKQTLCQLLTKKFDTIEALAITGNEKAMQYFEENKKSVQKIARLDFLNLQYLLPRQILQIPYDLLNRWNRRKLQKQNTGLVSTLRMEDYYLSKEAEEGLDLFFVVQK